MAGIKIIAGVLSVHLKYYLCKPILGLVTLFLNLTQFSTHSREKAYFTLLLMQPCKV
jgi:hypothetical protein